AVRHAETADARAAMPLEAPRESRGLVVLGAALLALSALRFPLPGKPAHAPRLTRTTGGEMEAAAAAARDLAEAARELKDPELNQLTKEVDALLHKLASGEITRKEFLEKLAELEQKYLGAKEGDFDALKEKL